MNTDPNSRLVESLSQIQTPLPHISAKVLGEALVRHGLLSPDYRTDSGGIAAAELVALELIAREFAASSQEITEAQVASWLLAQAADIAASSDKREGVTASIAIHRFADATSQVQWRVSRGPNFDGYTAQTFAGAVLEMGADTAQIRAAKKRAEAAKLLAEAAALEAKS